MRGRPARQTGDHDGSGRDRIPKPNTFLRTIANESRFEHEVTREEDREENLANSEGWNDNGRERIHRSPVDVRTDAGDQWQQQDHAPASIAV